MSPVRPAPSLGSAPLRLVTDAEGAAALAADPAVAERAAVVVATGLAETLRTAVPAGTDAVLVRAGAERAAATAVALRAAGVTVWWIDALRGRCPGAGAPALTSTWPDLESFDRVAELASRPGAGRHDGPAISVVVTTLNEGDALDRLVSGVVAQLSDRDQLVVVDGGSRDDSVERVTRAWKNESRVRLETVEGAGISQGRNIGVRLADHDVIACTDAGCDLAPGWVDGIRRAFAGDDPPGLVSGPYHPAGDGALAQAQSLACYPDPYEVARPTLLAGLYTRVFGTRFVPSFAIGRNVAFTRDAWSTAGGFPEHLPTGEDVSFGLSVARTHRAIGTSDAQVDWHQRPDLGATWRMYRSYGRSSTDGGDVKLLVRDGARGAAYVVGAGLVLTPRGRRLAAVGALAYLSLPVRRALRAQARPAVYPMIPVAIATKDLGKLAGAWQGYVRARRARG